MKIEDIGLGILLITPDIFADERGEFVESFRLCSEIQGPFVQGNTSVNKAGVIRGLHFQTKNPQGKLIRCVSGMILDVAVDIRPKSPTFGQHRTAWIGEIRHELIWIPPGFAHGFQAIDESIVVYECTTPFDPSSTAAIKYDDPSLQIRWSDTLGKVLSQKDRTAPYLSQLKERLYNG